MVYTLKSAKFFILDFVMFNNNYNSCDVYGIHNLNVLSNFMELVNFAIYNNLTVNV